MIDLYLISILARLNDLEQKMIETNEKLERIAEAVRPQKPNAKPKKT
jgi:hypothetical protein